MNPKRFMISCLESYKIRGFFVMIESKRSFLEYIEGAHSQAVEPVPPLHCLAAEVSMSLI